MAGLNAGGDTCRISGVELAIINNRIEGIARKMANTLLRTGRSGVLNIAWAVEVSMRARAEPLVAAIKATHPQAASPLASVSKTSLLTTGEVSDPPKACGINMR